MTFEHHYDCYFSQLFIGESEWTRIGGIPLRDELDGISQVVNIEQGKRFLFVGGGYKPQSLGKLLSYKMLTTHSPFNVCFRRN